LSQVCKLRSRGYAFDALLIGCSAAIIAGSLLVPVFYGIDSGSPPLAFVLLLIEVLLCAALAWLFPLRALACMECRALLAFRVGRHTPVAWKERMECTPICTNCGYLLVGSVLPRCPECGEPFPPEWLGEWDKSEGDGDPPTAGG
jgi:hypothetical protein